ncbi:DoxX family protein [Mucilaginibacter lappiensis]|uniref:Membrane protein YphA (DoxX/SURF4 family) n=1 Tax=Mucilaginibacter lappiensis TaxID=354630 RepID=A0A1N7F062_9SPHI|nr:DoxX family protein [Mucilaginibacter lappiensis]MBB6112156.1 putative membrane protein YphA (DoxX/SURF4 family) [Mucilaginibacter lappiensis]MBB6131281.1 putative membrane protein YphA (DoxX/SURF4 family) [Mucilaginibacter lappiensis]SIR93575.1 DoxX-like family protein [Mucilaginibacter lappiensis]
MTSTPINILAWVLRLAAAIIMLQTLYFKFTAAPESVYIFSTLGLEPWGRIGIGSLELIASILLLIPKTTSLGALLAVGIMAGALLSHLTKLGIVVQNDGGQLFVLALAVFICCSILLLIFRKQLVSYIPFIHA